MLIILRAVNNISGQLVHRLRCKRPISFALAEGRGQEIKRKETHREGDAWLCLFCMSLGQRDAGVVLANGEKCAFGYQLHLAQPLEVNGVWFAYASA